MSTAVTADTNAGEDLPARQTLAAWQEALASADPTPGGGAAAAVALGQAAALACMVAGLTAGKEKWRDGWSAAEAAEAVGRPLMDRSLVLAAEDCHAFAGYMEALWLPKETEAQQSRRRLAMEGASARAALIPARTAQAALELLKVLPDLAASGNGNAASDVGTAGLLAAAACKAALWNVEINAQSLPADEATPYLDASGRQRARCDDLLRATSSAVDGRM